MSRKIAEKNSFRFYRSINFKALGTYEEINFCSNQELGLKIFPARAGMLRLDPLLPDACT